ncbi:MULTISPECIES: cyclic nucleotide-binding domain-containing protein [unclassified Iodidimonas]|jgi:hypothetical protein|uniref:cyclic nucleotide-binding domain-containing protein n=1 Tax=unclassified Iodidimonas TaxID=2626145 RepID=UPI0024828E07|nr:MULTISPECIES: cyclic nucleotide-binding domain-containing protein [unclassified Iodidimonas]
MQTLKLKPGDLVYAEGDEAKAVYLIEEGAVEVSRQAAGRAVRLAVLGRGEIFGESGVIRNKAHSTSMKALTPCSLLEVTKPQFLKLFSDQNPLGLPMLRMLSERLEKVDERLLSGGGKSRDKALLTQIGMIRLLPAHEAMIKQMGEDGVIIEKLPFTLGLRTGQSDGGKTSDQHLLLGALKDYALSPEHFELEKRDGYLIIRDMGSYLGTIVNDQPLSRFGQEATAILHMGANSVIAGPKSAPYQFRIMVEPKAL